MTSPSMPGPAAAPVTPAPLASALPRFADTPLATGVRLRHAELGDPAGPPIILLHGASDSWFSFSGVLPALARHGRVLALDQRGHGRSDRPHVGYTMPHFAADVVAFMDAMQITRATIIGHSMGSIVAQHVAARAPERVHRLVLVGSSADVRNDVVRELHGAVAELPDPDPDPDPVPDAFVREFQLSTVHGTLASDFLETVIGESRTVPARVWRAMFAGMLAADARAALERIQAPTLILWGDRETVFSRAEQEALKAGLANAELRVYAETGHALHWERPERFVRDVGEFLAAPSPLDAGARVR